MGILQHLADRLRAIPAEVALTAGAKVEQGATEISNALFSQADGYSPYTADNAAYRAQFQGQEHAQTLESGAPGEGSWRAQFQEKEQSQELER